MPAVCSVLSCRSRQQKNQPLLTFHRMPRNQIREQKWIDILGKENMNPRHKQKYVCSLHFSESSFNRTLDVIRLKDDAVPLAPPGLPVVPTAALVPSTSYSALSDVTPGTLNEATQYSLLAKIEQQEKTLEKYKKRCLDQNNKVKSLNEQVRRRNKKISDLTHIITDLREKSLINTEEYYCLSECSGPQDFLKRQIAKLRGLPLEKKYSEEIRKFALTLHYFSPRAYDFVRQSYNTCLPHPRTLTSWYQNVNADPGFTKESFEALKRQVHQSTRPIICSLIFDEMSIRKGLTWDPKTKSFLGRVDCGQYINSDNVCEASQALVLLVNCINGRWKLPIGYFFITSLSGDQKAVLVKTALELCYSVGIKIVSITCDGPLSNFSMYSTLGFDFSIDKTTIEFKNTLVHAFLDPCHALKLIRNTFGELRVFVDHQGQQINFKYVEYLHKLQEEKGLHLATKISKAHIFYQKQKMKVRLATQILSASVADALVYCRDNLKMAQFTDCDGTVTFIRIINDVFDVLNSHSIYPPGWKKAICPKNIGFTMALFQMAIDYIRTLKLPSGELLVNSRRKTGFNGLIINMISTLSMYDYLIVKTEMLLYIPMYKVSQDHLELFFSSIRARGGFNNNPNAIQFRAAFKKLLIRAEIREGGVGNCVPLEQVNILTCTSRNPVTVINELCDRKSLVEIPEDHSDLYDEYINHLNNDQDEYTENVIEYISGFIVRKLSRSLKCDICLSLLYGHENVNSLIFQKTRGGLLYASCGVIDIVKNTEKLIKPQLLKIDSKPEQYYIYIFKFLVDFFSSENVFNCSDVEHNINHKYMLIKAVIKTYIDLRFRHHAKLINDKVSFRNYFTKLVLFRNE